jgi:hypothetical protein
MRDAKLPPSGPLKIAEGLGGPLKEFSSYYLAIEMNSATDDKVITVIFNLNFNTVK